MEIAERAAREYDFSTVRAAMQRQVDDELLAGVSFAVLRGRDLVEFGCLGQADRERGIALRSDHIFRVFSNSKLVTSCAALLLWEEGRFDLDDPIGRYLPALARLRVLRPGATRIDDAAPASRAVTVRHLMCHSAGFSLGLLDPGSLIFEAYREHGVRDRGKTLAEMVEVLGTLPLLFEPGSAFEYSVATDVLARLVEVLSGQRFDHFISERILAPLAMRDTGFVVPADQAHRLVALYAGADALDPTKPGLTRADDFPAPGAYLQPVPRLSGAGGLVSTLPDMVALIRALTPGGPTLLKPTTLASMMQNQLPADRWVSFADTGPMRGLGHGLAGAIAVSAVEGDAAAVPGEFRWGGIAGTQWLMLPRAGLSMLLMAQRQMAFMHPFAAEFKACVYRAMGVR